MLGANPHSRDSKGLSALEIAVYENKPTVVETLLAAGALVSAPSAQCAQALCYAIKTKASSKIRSLLLQADRHTDRSSSSEAESQAVLILNAVVESLRSSSDDQTRFTLYTLLDNLLKRRLALDPYRDSDKTYFHAFLDSLTGIQLSNTRTTHAAERCLKAFFQEGFSPFERYDRSGPGSVPTACAFLAAYALLHASSYEAMDQIVECCDVPKFGQELFYLLVNACKNSYWPMDAPPITTYLKALLNRGVQFDFNKNPLSLILQDFPNETPPQKAEKAEILRALMSWGGCKATESSSALGYPLDKLTKIPAPLIWDLAEIVLSQDEGLDLKSRNNLDELYDCVFVHHPLRCHENYLTLLYRAHLSCYSQSPYILEQCVVHVLIKKMIESKTHATRGQVASRVREALRLRHHMDLPDIPLASDNSAMLEILDGHANSLLALPMDMERRAVSRDCISDGDRVDSHIRTGSECVVT